NRAVVLTHKYFGGAVPENLKPEAIDAETLAEVLPKKEEVAKNLEQFRFRDAVRAAMDIARIGNKYLTDTEPWKVAKTDLERTASILNVSLQLCADLAVAFEPFLPFTCEVLRGILNVGFCAGYDHRAGEEGCVRTNMYKAGEGAAVHTIGLGDATGEVEERPMLSWETIGASPLPAGHKIGDPVLLFSKIEDSVVEAQLAKLVAMRQAKDAEAAADAQVTGGASDATAGGASSSGVEGLAPQKEECSFEDFGKMDIRVATVLAAERVPDTDKLLKLTIDTGLDTRTIVSGIAKYYAPEDMVGRQICILANLKPKKIRGIESKGMILMARQPDGEMRFVTPERPVENGSDVG
ncbi:MAG: methionine--tRNA ligase subunit beta, partial [Bacteroidales bacterium]|nr:methionine--tRNA ligase subunit beta [Bacteroidales bacterium]